MAGRPPTADPASRTRRGGLGSRLRDARIRSKLGLILVIPLVAVVGLAGLRLVDSGQQAGAAELARALTTLSSTVSDVSHELHRERMAAALLLAAAGGESDEFSAQAKRTDRALAEYSVARGQVGAVPAIVGDRLRRVDEQLESVNEIRQNVLGENTMTVSAAVLRYRVIIEDLTSYQESVGQIAGETRLAESIRAIAALSKAKMQMSEAQAVAFLALRDGSPDQEQLTLFLGALTGQQESMLAFLLSATPEQRTLVSTTLTGAAVALADRAANNVIRSASGRPLISAGDAARALGTLVDLVRWVELRLQEDLQVLAADVRDNVLRQVLTESVAVLLALIIAITLAVVVARVLVGSLSQLREGALAVAERELPDTVARLSDPQAVGEHTPAQLAAQVRDPIQLRGGDEIGQVAQSFNVVHRAAVRVAAEQAALRTSVSAMFLNLARRSQSLVDRMINQLDDIERHEEDPTRLSRLFALDHLATRMRRNDENLLVLAGADSSPPRSDDALVADALRAAQSEVEHYDRIEFGTVDTDVSIVAGAVNDVVRLVAELFDNATRFSPPEVPVVAEARRLGDQVIVQIEDRGVGMSQEQADQINAWLAAPPAVELTTFRRMGLAVVGRLASRHGIRVELRCDPAFGTVAYVALPRSVLILPRSRTRGGEVPWPRTPAPAELEPREPVPARHIGQLPRRPATMANAVGNAVSNDLGNNLSNHVARHTPAPAPAAAAAEPAPRVDVPVAGRPLYQLTTADGLPQPQVQPSYPAAAAADSTAELPIFREMEAVWFRSHGGLDLGPSAPPAAGPVPSSPAPNGPAPNGPATVMHTGLMPGGPIAGAPPAPYAPPAAPAMAPPPAAPPPPVPVGASAAADPRGRESDPWRTAADFGWQAASAAAAPPVRDSTKSGLPKRVPQAQLVPGGVQAPEAPAAAQRRSPDEVRGLLSAYHRGVQRGRASGTNQ